MDTQSQNANKMFVGNLPYQATEDQLRQAFGQFGSVTDVYIATDRATGRARGFAFVTMSTAQEANAAVEGMHNKDFNGRSLVVNIARPKAPRENFNRSY